MNREVIRTKNFVADAANFIVDLARKALAERNEFRIALSVGYASPHLHGAGANSAGSSVGKNADHFWRRTLCSAGR